MGPELCGVSSGDFKVKVFICFLVQSAEEDWCARDCILVDSKCLSFRDLGLSSDDYVKDETTNLTMAAPTEETCRDNYGFVCKVNDCGSVLDDDHNDDEAWQ